MNNKAVLSLSNFFINSYPDKLETFPKPFQKIISQQQTNFEIEGIVDKHLVDMFKSLLQITINQNYQKHVFQK